jgi:hypothetical protein
MCKHFHRKLLLYYSSKRRYILFFPRGEDIFISVWNLHRCPKHWEDADVFNPERWPLDGPNPNETNQKFRFHPITLMKCFLVHHMSLQISSLLAVSTFCCKNWETFEYG